MSRRISVRLTLDASAWRRCKGSGVASIVAAVIFFLTLGSSILGQVAPISVSGTVEDSSGAVIPGAHVEFSNGDYHASAASNSSGKFHFAIAAASGTMDARAAGFLSVQIAWQGESSIKVVLHPKFESNYASQHVLVTATRIDTALEDSPADSVSISQEDLTSRPALTLDDVLREVPGFDLFRRNSSRTANPGTQGVSMRGLGASGASRALVLVNEVPLNDPFGGWVYWDRVAPEAISSVEVVRGGGGASLYGSSAMGGVIQFRTREPEAPAVSIEGSWGNENTPSLSLWTGTRIGPWEASLSADVFRTNGYIPVPASQRGIVDTPANSRHGLTTLDLARHFGSGLRFFVRGSYFSEGRHNGTRIVTNGTRIGDFATGWNHDDKRIGTVSARLFGLYESYDQLFSSSTKRKRSARHGISYRQPASSLADDGGKRAVVASGGTLADIAGGIEMRAVGGSSNEDLFRLGVPNGSSLSGGQERTARIFGEDILQLGPRVIANLSLGYDYWSDRNARLITINSGGTTLTPYPIEVRMRSIPEQHCCITSNTAPR